MFGKIFGAVLTLTCLTVVLLADETTDKTKEEEFPPPQHEIVVTATRLDTPTKEIASSITVITKEQLKDQKSIPSSKSLKAFSD